MLDLEPTPLGNITLEGKAAVFGKLDASEPETLRYMLHAVTCTAETRKR